MAGWTPAYTMGFKFNRILNSFDGPFQAIPYGEIQQPKGDYKVTGSAAGYIIDSRCDNSFIAVNTLLKAGLDVFRLKSQAGTPAFGSGSFFIPENTKAKAILEKASNDLSLSVTSVSKRPVNLSGKLSPLRIAIWDTYGGSMPAGWLKWIMEQHNFSFKSLYVREINEGNLQKKYDVIIFVGGAIPSISSASQFNPRDTARNTGIPDEYRAQTGRISADTSIIALKKFMESGGTVVTIGNSTNLAYHLKLPVTNALTEIRNGIQASLPSDKYYIPGSVLRVRIDTVPSFAWGMESKTDVIFNSSPVFRITPAAVSQGAIKPIAWFDSDEPLRSGWAWGQQYLKDGVAAFEAKVGSGRLYAFGPEITFRAQTYSTFKLLFNQLYSGY
jgi:hypothetical protein